VTLTLWVHCGQVVKDTVWYRKARANPAVYLPHLYRFMATPRVRSFLDKMTEEKRRRYKDMGNAFLEAAEEKHITWNGTTWTRARHLLGVLCLEERRDWFACDLLRLLGHRVNVTVALDEVDLELRAKLLAVHADGSLAKELGLWGLTGPVFIDELRLLATEPAGFPILSFLFTPPTIHTSLYFTPPYLILFNQVTPKLIRSSVRLRRR